MDLEVVFICSIVFNDCPWTMTTKHNGIILPEIKRTATILSNLDLDEAALKPEQRYSHRGQFVYAKKMSVLLGVPTKNVSFLSNVTLVHCYRP